jgi:hypothetical protein
MYAVFLKKDKNGNIIDSFTVIKNQVRKPISVKTCLKFINRPDVMLYGKNVEGSLVYAFKD